MAKKQKPYDNGLVYWVVVRDENTNKLIRKHMCGTMQQAKEKKLELDEAVDPDGMVCEVTIESKLWPDEPSPS